MGLMENLNIQTLVWRKYTCNTAHQVILFIKNIKNKTLYSEHSKCTLYTLVTCYHLLSTCTPWWHAITYEAPLPTDHIWIDVAAKRDQGPPLHSKRLRWDEVDEINQLFHKSLSALTNRHLLSVRHCKGCKIMTGNWQFHLSFYVQIW